MHRFYVQPEYINDTVATICGDELKHLKQVLRLKTGDTITIFDGMGKEYNGIIDYIGQDQAEVKIELIPSEKESSIDIWLVQGLPKGDKMEFIIQKATELGVRGIIPLEARRSIVRLQGKKREERRKRWQKVALEACKQCGRTIVPQVLSPQGLVGILDSMSANNNILIPWEEGGRPMGEVLKGNVDVDKPVYIIIGPEGGLEENEVEIAKEYGAIPVTLGPRIMRTETAGLVSIAITMYQWGDLG